MTAPQTRSPASLGVRVVPKGLLLPDGLDFDEWLKVGKELAGKANHTLWAIADWLSFGEFEYGERYKLGAEITGLDESTLRDLKYVGGRFNMSRRRDNLSLAHHRVVAALTEPEQDQWLDRAHAEGWSRNQLREQLSGGPRELDSGSSSVVRVVYRVNATPQDDALFARAAERRGLDVGEWLLDVAREHARAELEAAA